jgi:nicotinate-nucleotide pyrophosphorylase (carboxylating)
MKVAAEAMTPQIALELAEAGADILMLDNFTPAQVREALALLDPQGSAIARPLIELTGGINPENLDDYLIDGVDVISLGCLTHSVKSLDISLEVSPRREGGLSALAG